jgi:hypothetical protein
MDRDFGKPKTILVSVGLRAELACVYQSICR